MMTVPTTTSINALGRIPKKLHYALWVVQILLAVVFLAAGAMKLTQPIASLPESIQGLPLPLVRLIGVCELFGVIGLILPTLMRIKQGLTALAATCLSAVMFLASAHHFNRGEFTDVPVTLALTALAAFVAWGRWK